MRIGFSGPRIFGIRPWVSFPLGNIRRANNAAIEEAFVYVIKDESGRIKIGSSADPSRRLKELQTGHPERLSIEFIGVSPINGYNIEQEAHSLLNRYRINNEWFAVSTTLAISAVYGAADRLNQPLQQVTEKDAMRILQITANEMRPRKIFEPSLKFLLWLLAIIFVLSFVSAYFTTAKTIFPDWDDLGAEEKAIAMMTVATDAIACGTEVPYEFNVLGAAAANNAWGSDATTKAAMAAMVAGATFRAQSAETKLTICNEVRGVMRAFKGHP